MPVQIGPTREYSLGIADSVMVDFTDWLDEGELLSAFSVTDVPNLGRDNVAVNTEVLFDSHRKANVAVGKAGQFTIEPTQAGTYDIPYVATSDSTPARKDVAKIVIKITA